MNKYKTVKEVCDLTGLTRKHLYYFHHENVVRAVAYANYSVEGYNGYKLYDDIAVEKLQQISDLLFLVSPDLVICDFLPAREQGKWAGFRTEKVRMTYASSALS